MCGLHDSVRCSFRSDYTKFFMKFVFFSHLSRVILYSDRLSIMFIEYCIYVLLSVMFIEKLLVWYCVVSTFIDYIYREAKYYVVFCRLLLCSILFIFKYCSILHIALRLKYVYNYYSIFYCLKVSDKWVYFDYSKVLPWRDVRLSSGKPIYNGGKVTKNFRC